MSKKKIKNKKKDKRYIVPNISTVVLALYLGGIYIYEVMDAGRDMAGIIVSVLLMALLAFVLLLLTFIYREYLSIRAFYIPVTLFLFYTSLMAFDGWILSSNYLLACLCFCVISCLYYNLRLTIIYVIAQYAVIGILIASGYTVAGPGVHLVNVWFTWFISLFGALSLLFLARTATVVLGRAASDQNSFRVLLSTTTNIIIMVDEFNRVVYASKSLSELSGIDDPQLIVGRPLIDLLPGRDLKLLAHKMLKNKSTWGISLKMLHTSSSDDWEFMLNGQKRYFKVISTGLTGTTNSALVSLTDMTYLAERNEISVMKDSLQIGLFFMDKDYIIQDHYSRFLEEMLEETELFGKPFPELLAASVNAKELATIQDYFDMVLSRSLDQSMLKDINPLN
jgi:PAS domain-containing protein